MAGSGRGLERRSHRPAGRSGQPQAPPAGCRTGTHRDHDGVAWREYLEAVVADREGWGDFYEACRALD